MKPSLLLLSPGSESLIAPDVGVRFDMVRLWESDDPDAMLNELGVRIQAVFATEVDARLMERLPALQLIVVPGAGYERVDVDCARRRGVRVVNAGDAHSQDVADHATAMTLAIVHRLKGSDQWVRDGKWQAGASAGRRRAMSSHRFGIVGLGNIGRLIAQRIAVFDGELAWWGPTPRQAEWAYKDSLLELARWSSVLIVASRGDAVHLIGPDVIEAVGASGTIVNISRGAVIDEAALISALKTGRLGAAALDVFEDEPATADRWRDVPNVLLTPHVGGVSDRALARLREAASTNLRSLLDGTPAVHEVSA